MSRQKLKETIISRIESDSNSSKSLAVHAETQPNNIIAIIDALTESKGLGITEETVELLGASGVTVKNACSILHKSFQFFDEHPKMKAAFERGRANLGSRVRGKLIEAALEHNNIQSAIHLDKIFSADAAPTEVNLNVTSNKLAEVSDAELLNIAFTVDDNNDNDDTNIG